MARPSKVQALFKQTHAFFKENAQVKANMCKNHNLAAPQEYQPQAQTFFEQTHAFFKENAQVKANMCKNQTLAAPQEYQPLESGPVVSKDNGTEGQQFKDGGNKGPLGVIKSCAHFLFTGPSIYPLIE